MASAPIKHPAAYGFYSCPECGAINTATPENVSYTFAYTDRRAEPPVDHYYPMHKCFQCGNNTECIESDDD